MIIVEYFKTHNSIEYTYERFRHADEALKWIVANKPIHPRMYKEI